MDPREKNALHPHRHPWELSRARSLRHLLQKNPRSFRYADIGAGDQYFAQELLSLTTQPIVTVDVASPPTQTPRIQGYRRVEELAPNSMDCLLLLDVLEHVEQDDAFLSAALSRLKPGGQLVITVPAHPVLFSNHDVFLKHVRRYRRRDLLALVRRQGLLIHEDFYFYNELMVLRALEKALRLQQEPGIGHWPWRERHPLTWITVALLDLDFKTNRALGKWGVRIPGLSLCLVCQKPSA